MNQELPDIKAGFRKSRGTRDQIANILWIREKATKFQKNICFVDYAKAFNYVDRNKLWKILKEMGIPDYLPAFCETCMRVKKQQLELDIEQQTGSKFRKEYIKTVYCHQYLSSMQSTPCEMLGWMNHKLESRLLVEYQHFTYADDTTLRPESKKELESLLMKVKEDNEKLKIQHSRNLRPWHLVPSLHGKQKDKKWKQ